MVSDADRHELDALSKRIGEAQKASSAEPKERQSGPTGPSGRGIVRAVKLGSDFVTLIMGMAFFGWLVDRHLATAPWFMIGTMSIGFVAGFWVLIRALGRKDEGGASSKVEGTNGNGNTFTD
ncbi:MAG: AtpZ/AtpI family protein [Bdellovibrionales bacterium]